MSVQASVPSSPAPGSDFVSAVFRFLDFRFPSNDLVRV